MPTPCATRVLRVPVLPWIPLYPDHDDTDVEATQMTKAVLDFCLGVEYMQVLTSLSQTGISLPHLVLVLFDIIQTYSILVHPCVCEFRFLNLHQSQLPVRQD
jgi:hypothetical protein